LEPGFSAGGNRAAQLRHSQDIEVSELFCIQRCERRSDAQRLRNIKQRRFADLVVLEDGPTQDALSDNTVGVFKPFFAPFSGQELLSSQ
jgi:hypothetical protein